MEQCSQLSSMSLDMRTKSKQLLARNLAQSQAFFDRLKAFIDFLSLPNYSKEEVGLLLLLLLLLILVPLLLLQVRQKRGLADKITRLMFEEEQRLRRGLELSELQKLDKILTPMNSLKPRLPPLPLSHPHSPPPLLSFPPPPALHPSPPAGLNLPTQPPLLQHQSLLLQQSSLLHRHHLRPLTNR